MRADFEEYNRDPKARTIQKRTSDPDFKMLEPFKNQTGNQRVVTLANTLS
jgi:hypothetical protein